MPAAVLVSLSLAAVSLSVAMFGLGYAIATEHARTRLIALARTTAAALKLLGATDQQVQPLLNVALEGHAP